MLLTFQTLFCIFETKVVTELMSCGTIYFERGMRDMPRGHYLFAAQKYRCSYHCTRCGKENREYAFVRAADPVWFNGFTDNLYDEMHLSGEIATNKAQKRFYRFQARVNDACWYWGLRVSGRCRKCGKRQSWSPAIRHALALVLAMVCLAVFLWQMGEPVEAAYFLQGAAIALGVFLIGEGVGLIIVRLWAHREPEQCLPWIEAIHKR